MKQNLCLLSAVTLGTLSFLGKFYLNIEEDSFLEKDLFFLEMIFNFATIGIVANMMLLSGNFFKRKMLGSILIIVLIILVEMRVSEIIRYYNAVHIFTYVWIVIITVYFVFKNITTKQIKQSL